MEKLLSHQSISSSKDPRVHMKGFLESLKESVNFQIGKNSSEQDCNTDYREYVLSLKEYVFYVALAAGLEMAVVYTFYRSWMVFLIVLPAALIYPFFKRTELREKRKNELKIQFKEAIQFMASSISAGYSTENALKVTTGNLIDLYGEEAMITREFRNIALKIRMNRTMEELFRDLGERSGVEEIRNFAEIFAVSKRSRGELVPVVNHVSGVIGDKIAVHEEILNMTSEKKFEQKIMNGMPFFIILYVDMSSPGFFTPMYTSLLGRTVMTVALILYVAAILLARKILDIKV